jgi:hypothetical protein
MTYQEENPQKDAVKEDRFHYLRSVIKGTWFVEISIAFLIFLIFIITKIFG